MPPAIPERPRPGDRAELAAEVVGQMQIIGRRVRRQARPVLAPLGLTPAQVRALHELGRAAPGHGGVDPGVRMGALAAALDVVPRSATDVVEALEALGLVARGPDPSDGRAVVVALTSAGRDLLHELADRRRDAAVEALGHLTADELRTLHDLLARALDPD